MSTYRLSLAASVLRFEPTAPSVIVNMSYLSRNSSSGL
jgi:hypothetical protein